MLSRPGTRVAKKTSHKDNPVTAGLKAEARCMAAWMSDWSCSCQGKNACVMQNKNVISVSFSVHVYVMFLMTRDFRAGAVLCLR